MILSNSDFRLWDNIRTPEKADLIFADLPFGKTKNAYDIIIPPDEVWEAFKPWCHDRTVIVLAGMQPFTSLMIMSNPKMFRYEIIWAKTAGTDFLNAKVKPLSAHENLMVFYRKKPIYVPQKTTGHPRKVSTAEHKRNSTKTTNYGEHGLTGYDSTERYPTTVWKIGSDKQKSSIHPNQKPVALLERLILSYTNENSIVMDPCFGSGTTAIACINTGRRFIGMEKDPVFFNDARERVNNHLNKNKT